MDLERDIADFLGTMSSIHYSRGLSKMSRVNSAFKRRSDFTVTDCGISRPFARRFGGRSS
jgi:serine palmitoyltransferase